MLTTISTPPFLIGRGTINTIKQLSPHGPSLRLHLRGTALARSTAVRLHRPPIEPVCEDLGAGPQARRLPKLLCAVFRVGEA